MFQNAYVDDCILDPKLCLWPYLCWQSEQPEVKFTLSQSMKFLMYAEAP